jgi:hypothetical protein
VAASAATAVVAGTFLAAVAREIATFDLRHLGEQPFAVGDRDLIVVGMDLAEGEEAVAVAAVVDERRLQRRLDPRHLGKIDVSLELLLGRRLKVEVFQAIAGQHDDPGLFRVRRVDEHAFGHQARSPRGRSRDARHSGVDRSRG